MKKLLLCVAGLLILSIVLLQFDDELNPEARRLIDKFPNSADSQAYLHLMGIYAAPDEAPVDVGRQILASVSETKVVDEIGFTFFDVMEYDEAKKLPLPQGEAFCRLTDQGCLEAVFSPAGQYAELVAQHELVKQRYEEFVQFGDYHTMTEPDFAEPIPSYQYLARGNRLLLLDAIGKAERSGPVVAIRLINENLNHLRRHFRITDTLIGKMLLLNLISDNVDVLSILSRRSDAGNTEPLELLSANERDFGLPIGRELAAVYSLYHNLDGHPEFWQAGSNMPGFLVKTVFKPNMSLNTMFPHYQKVISLSTLPQHEFVGQLDTAQDGQPGMSKLRNWVGHTLAAIANPSFDEYVARAFDVNAKIALYNQVLESPEVESSLGSLVNPYYASEGQAFLQSEGRQVCFEGPLPDDRGHRCLWLEI